MSKKKRIIPKNRKNTPNPVNPILIFRSAIQIMAAEVRQHVSSERLHGFMERMKPGSSPGKRAATSIYLDYGDNIKVT